MNNTSDWVLLDQIDPDEAQFPTNLENECDTSSESNENNSLSTTHSDHTLSNVSTSSLSSGYPRKRKADDEKVAIDKIWTEFSAHLTGNPLPLTGLQPWLVALAITLEKMPAIDQAELKIAIGAMVGKRELELLKKHDDMSVRVAESS